MIAQIAADLAVSEAQINLKAKTNERLGWEGREEGIAAQAIALLLQK
jgi:2-C-methyl-D-erythritol 2,4-cyclodiphosphate synthase